MNNINMDIVEEKFTNIFDNTDKTSDLLSMYFRFLIFMPLLDAVLINFAEIGIGLGFAGNFIVSTIILFIYAKVKYNDSASKLLSSINSYINENIGYKGIITGILCGLVVAIIIFFVAAGVIGTLGNFLEIDILPDIIDVITIDLYFATCIYTGALVGVLVAVSSNDEEPLEMEESIQAEFNDDDESAEEINYTELNNNDELESEE